MKRKTYAKLIAVGSALTLGACGGDGSMQTGFLPPPPTTVTPPPPPAGATAVTILPDPVAGQFATAGVWTNLYSASSSAEGRFEGIESDPSKQPAIRYSSGGYYEVELPGEDFGALVHDSNIANPAPDDPFLSVTDCCGTRSFTLDYSKSGYTYSALATWSRPDLDFAFTTDSGVVAFGSPTAAESVPVTGTASYEGVAAGLSDAKTYDSASNSWLLLPASGTVRLNFDFDSGSLGGQFDLSVAGGMNPLQVGTYTFAQTVFSRGSTTYSGSFATALAGANFFNGLFTGPNAEETIGRWAVPFQLNGETHQAIGAWMAKSGQ